MIITGASGMLGRALMQALAAYQPVGTALSRAGGNLVRLDLTDQAEVTTFLTQQRPNIIIHAAAERRPDVSEKQLDQTTALNVTATQHLASVAKDIGAFVLYLSTDYVFDGLKPPYQPSDQTNPLNFYGRTKLLGEEALFATLDDAAALRVGVLFGQVETPAESAVMALADIVRNSKPQTVDDWARRYPTYIPDLAVVIRQMVERQLAGKSMRGIWHWCGEEQYSKYAQAIAIGKILNLPTTHLAADPNLPAGAPRPRDCRLNCSALEMLGIGQRTRFEMAMADALRVSNIT